MDPVSRIPDEDPRLQQFCSCLQMAQRLSLDGTDGLHQRVVLDRLGQTGPFAMGDLWCAPTQSAGVYMAAKVFELSRTVGSR